MGEKLKPKRSPEANEAHQAARAAKRERARDDRTVALIAGILMARRGMNDCDCSNSRDASRKSVSDAREILSLAKESA